MMSFSYDLGYDTKINPEFDVLTSCLLILLRFAGGVSFGKIRTGTEIDINYLPLGVVFFQQVALKPNQKLQ